jgi:aminopeptidase N
MTWLNEGFATLFEYLLVENVHKDMRMRDYFNIYKVQNAFIVDSVDSIHPMTFDGPRNTRIVYDKCKETLKK